jgi:hypothetical protein
MSIDIDSDVPVKYDPDGVLSYETIVGIFDKR